MVQLGLNQSDLERIIISPIDSIMARGSSRDKTELLADALQHALREIARAIVENNRSISEQLTKAGVVIT